MSEVGLPRIDTGDFQPQYGDIFDPEVYAWILQRRGLGPDGIGEQVLRLSGGRPSYRSTEPTGVAFVEWLVLARRVNAVTTEIFPDNLTYAARSGPTGPLNLDLAAELLVEQVDIAAQEAVMGEAAIRAENGALIASEVRGKKIRGGLGVVAVGTTSGALLAAMEKFDVQPLWAYAAVGLVVLLTTAARGVEGIRAAQAKRRKYHDFFRTWPIEVRAKEFASQYRSALVAGEARPFVRFPEEGRRSLDG
jgi:hypothetical protein